MNPQLTIAIKSMRAIFLLLVFFSFNKGVFQLAFLKEPVVFIRLCGFCPKRENRKK